MHTPGTPSPPPAGPPAPGHRSADEAIDASRLDELSPAEFAALQWSVRVSDGLTVEARTAFEAWLAADAAHRSAYEDMAGVWDAIDGIPPAGQARLRATVAIDAAAASSVPDASPAPASPPAAAPAAAGAPAAAEPIARAMPGAEPPHAMPPAAPRRDATRLRRAPQALAAALSLAVVAGGWLGWNHWQAQPTFSHAYATERGQRLDAALPDGSSLLLDTASAADVTLYRGRREVRLPEGQVLFRVQGDRSRPFDVLAGASRITVVGTTFSVRHTPSMGSDSVQVAVIEGRVQVSANAAGDAGRGHAVELTAGQSIVADARGGLGPVSQAPVEALAAWRGQRLNFDGVPLAQVLAEIGRYGDIGVRMGDAAVGRLPVTASVDLRRPDAFIRALPRVLPVRLVPGDAGLEIVASRR